MMAAATLMVHMAGSRQGEMQAVGVKLTVRCCC